MQRKPIFHVIPQVMSFGWKLKIKTIGADKFMESK